MEDTAYYDFKPKKTYEMPGVDPGGLIMFTSITYNNRHHLFPRLVQSVDSLFVIDNSTVIKVLHLFRAVS